MEIFRLKTWLKICICVGVFFIPACLLIISSPLKADEARDASEFERSILHLTVTRALPDPESPWAIQNIDVAGHAGIVVGMDRVLTQASIVSHAVYIQAQRVDDVEKVPMRVVFADYEANLALLEPTEGYHLRAVKALDVGPDIAVGSDVWLVAIENERQLQRVQLRTMEVGIREATVGGMTVPVYSLSGQSRTKCNTDPIIRQGKLVGLCVGIADSQPQAITAGVINHFLKDDLTSGSYRGFGSIGLNLLPVRSPLHRKILGVPAGKGALRVSSVHATSPFADCVKTDDIVQAIDQVPVDHRGFYPHPKWGYVPVRHYVIAKYPGEKMTLHLRRAGQPLVCSGVLRRFSSQDNLIPGLTHEGGVAHIIFGGLVFRELSVDYLSAYGRDWPKNSPISYSFTYSYFNSPKIPVRRQVILSHVLSDVFNAGYEKMTNLILETVNGEAVSSMAQLESVLKKTGILRDGAEYAKFDFDQGAQIVIPYTGLSEAHSRISKAYAVTDSKSFFVR